MLRRILHKECWSKLLYSFTQHCDTHARTHSHIHMHARTHAHSHTHTQRLHSLYLFIEDIRCIRPLPVNLYVNRMSMILLSIICEQQFDCWFDFDMAIRVSPQFRRDIGRINGGNLTQQEATQHNNYRKRGACTFISRIAHWVFHRQQILIYYSAVI